MLIQESTNSCLPAFRFPPEILEKIFVNAARAYQENNCYPTSRAPHWVNVSYVCYQWRIVALNCPALWTHHFIVSLRWTEELLARSKREPLKIRFHFDHNKARPKSWWSRLVEKVLKQAERIQELCLYLPGDVLPTHISLNTSYLRILDIDALDRSFEQTFMVYHGDTLPLHTLKLTGVSLPWHSFNLNGVTTLSLRSVPRLFQQNIAEFLATLRRMQLLTELYIENALPSSRGFLSYVASSVFRKVNLPCLIRLSVDAPLSTTTALLSCIDIPSKTQLQLRIGPDNASIGDYALLPSVLAQKFGQYEYPSSATPATGLLVIRFTYHTTLTFTASGCEDYDPNLPKTYSPWSSDVNICLETFPSRITTQDRDRIVGDICCSIPSTRVRTLHVICPPSSSALWGKMLGHFDGLRRIILSDGILPDLLSYPSDKASEDPSSGSRSIQRHGRVPALELELIRIYVKSKDGLLSCICSEKALLDATVT